MRPFADSLEWLEWESWNCSWCRKCGWEAAGRRDRENFTTCEINIALSQAAAGDGTVPAGIARRMGRIGDIPSFRCSEFEKPECAQ